MDPEDLRLLVGTYDWCAIATCDGELTEAITNRGRGAQEDGVCHLVSAKEYEYRVYKVGGVKIR